MPAMPAAGRKTSPEGKNRDRYQASRDWVISHFPTQPLLDSRLKTAGMTFFKTHLRNHTLSLI